MVDEAEDVCKNYGWFHKGRPTSSRRTDVHSQVKKNLNDNDSDDDKHVRKHPELELDRT